MSGGSLTHGDTESQLHEPLENHYVNGEGVTIHITCIYQHFLFVVNTSYVLSHLIHSLIYLKMYY